MGGGTYLAQFRRHKRKEVEGGSWEGWCPRRPAKRPPLDPRPSRRPRPPSYPSDSSPTPCPPQQTDIHADWLWQKPIRALPPRSLRASPAPRAQCSPATRTTRRGGEGARQPGASRRPEWAGWEICEGGLSAATDSPTPG